MDIPIFTGGVRHQKVQQAKVGFEQAELRLQQAEEGLYLDLANKRNNYEAAMNQLENTKSTATGYLPIKSNQRA